MSSALTVIVLGHAFFGNFSLPNLSPVRNNYIEVLGSIQVPRTTDIPNTTELTEEPTTSIPEPEARRPDYTYTLGIGGHKVHSKVATWNTARKICEREGGYLAIINSVAESEIIAQLFRASLPHVGSSNSGYVHIGFHDLYQEGEYITVHGESLKNVGFNEWQGSGPDNRDDDENCGSVYITGRLNDISCKKSYGFVCEVPYVEGSLIQPQ